MEPFLTLLVFWLRGSGRCLRLGGGTDDGACVRMHTIGGSGGMLPQIKIRCSEITSEIIFVPKCH